MAREFGGGIRGELVNGRGGLRAGDVGRIARVVRVCLTFAGERMKGNGLVRNVIHGGEGGAGEKRLG